MVSCRTSLDASIAANDIRNVCILAHVDHGKTTLADSLLSSNGIISSRLAGKLKYLDSLPEEQIRGITMKSSCVGLSFTADNGQYFLVNVLDSPGHVDFCGEVSTAMRLSDGALILIDVVEGVCPQTLSLLRQAWKECLKPILVLNKIDRLISELKLSPGEAYSYLHNLLGQVNAVAGELFVSMAIDDEDEKHTNNIEQAERKRLSSVRSQTSQDAIDSDEWDWSKVEADLYFVPQSGNVIFASALDGWGFRLSDFVKLFASKTGIRDEILEKTMWGDFYLDSKAKRIKMGAQNKGKKPLFVQFVLDNIWLLYDTILINKDKEKLAKMAKSLKIELASRDLRHQDSKILLQALMSQWLSLSKSVLQSVCEKLPSPDSLDEQKVKLLLTSSNRPFESLPKASRNLKQTLLNCDPSASAPVIVNVSKLVALERRSLPKHQRSHLSEEAISKLRQLAIDKHVRFSSGTADRGPVENGDVVSDVHEFNVDDPVVDESEYVFVAFARVYSGTLRTGQELLVLLPTHDVNKCTDDSAYVDSIPKCQLEELYILMGKEVRLVDEVSAGHIVGIIGLEKMIMKTATLSDTPFVPPFTRFQYLAEPIVRVAIEPTRPIDLPKLVEGLKLLNQADPSVKTLVQNTGEHVLVASGEIHLQRCIEDLKKRYSKIDIQVSEPIIPFKETIILPPKLDMMGEVVETEARVGDGELKNSVEVFTSNKEIKLKLVALPLPELVVALLDKNEDLLRIVEHLLDLDRQTRFNELNDQLKVRILNFKQAIQVAFENSECSFWDDRLVDRLWAFGSSKSPCNMLLNGVDDYTCRPSLWSQLLDVATPADSSLYRDFDHSLRHGFHLACTAGPLCEEPLKGVAFLVEEWKDVSGRLQSPVDDTKAVSSYGPISGQLIATMKDACRLAFQAQPQRLLIAMYQCQIQATTEVLGKVYSVIGRRNGRVIGEEMKEGTQLFQINASLPVVESFGFAEEIRIKTSGLALPQLVFSHWEVLDIDPFWVPTTEEELEHFGDKADNENRAKRYMNVVRKRKGLKVDEKIVEHAEKQRTLTKNK